MYLPPPSLVPVVAITNLREFMTQFSGLKSVSGGIAIYGPAAAYALVWELGSRRLQSPGPKTVWGRNRNGERVILTRQAPRGYIGVAAESYPEIMRQELAKVSFTGSVNTIQLRLQIAIDNISLRIARLASDLAPVDTGALRAGIQMVDSEETSLLSSANLESGATLIL